VGESGLARRRQRVARDRRQGGDFSRHTPFKEDSYCLLDSNQIEEQQMGRAETLYSELRDLSAIEGLIGQPEDSYLDCKEWPAKDDDAQKLLAKANVRHDEC
jgi:hypothetical protein